MQTKGMRFYSPQETKLSASLLVAEDKVYFRALQTFTNPASSGGDSITETVHRERNPGSSQLDRTNTFTARETGLLR